MTYDSVATLNINSCGEMSCVTTNMTPELFLGQADGVWKRSSHLLIDKRKDAGIRYAIPQVADFNGDGVMKFRKCAEMAPPHTTLNSRILIVMVI